MKKEKSKRCWFFVFIYEVKKRNRFSFLHLESFKKGRYDIYTDPPLPLMYNIMDCSVPVDIEELSTHTCVYRFVLVNIQVPLH